MPELIAVCGGRGYTDAATVRKVLLEYTGKGPTILLHGGARGADALAHVVACALGFDVRCFRADWERHGKAAGPIRNRILDNSPDLVVAFPGGRGTADMVGEARRRGVPVREVSP